MAGGHAPRDLRTPRRLAAAVPSSSSLTYLRGVVAPGTRDRALDAVEAHAREGALVISGVERLGLDALAGRGDGAGRGSARQRAQMPWRPTTYVASGATAPEAVAGLGRALDGRAREPVVTARGSPSGGAPGCIRRGVRLRLGRGWLSASENAAELPQACDGRDETWWRTEGAQRPGDWLAVALPEPARLDRVELCSDAHGRFAARELQGARLRGRPREDVGSRPARAGRPRRAAGRRKDPSQVFLLRRPWCARALRLVLTRPGAHRWGVAELVVDTRVE